MTSILTVYGTRPEAIKLAPVIRELELQGVDQTVCITGQHRGLLDDVNEIFNITPDFDLNVMRSNQTPTSVAAAVVGQMERVIGEVNPDWLVVQGDTTTVLAASLAAAYAGVRVAHVEAGLRSGNRSEPFPEEINRIATTALADRHFPPTTSAQRALAAEGVSESAIILTGNTVIDALHWAIERARALPESDVLPTVDPSKKLLLVTTHRRENFGQPLQDVLLAVRQLAEDRRGTIQILFPVHPNPSVAGPVHEILGGLESVFLCEPLGYIDFVRALDASYFVLTDSGGIQEEAPAVGKPVLVLRDVTERPEALANGCAALVGTNRERIMAAACSLLDDEDIYQSMTSSSSPFGDGHASFRIVRSLLDLPVEPFVP